MKRFLFFVMLLALTFSCQKKWDFEPIAPQTGDIESLKVPADFDWKMNRTITIDGSFLAGGGVVSITSPDGKIIFYKGMADGKPVTVTVPVIYEDVLINGQSYNQMNLMKDKPFLKGTMASSYTYVNNITYFPSMQYDAVRLNDNTFAVLMFNGHAYVPYIVLANVAGNTVTYSSPVQIGGSGYYVIPRLLKIGENKLLAAYIDRNNGDRIRFHVLTVSGSNVISGFSNYLSSSQVRNFEMDCLEDGKVAFAYIVPFSGSNFNITTRILSNLLTNSPTLGNEYTVSDSYPDNFGYRIDIATLTPTKYIIGSFMSPSYNGLLSRARVIELVGSNLQGGQLVNINSNAMTQKSSDILKISEDKVLFFYMGLGGRLFYRFGQVSGANIGLGPEFQYEQASNFYHLKTSLIDQSTLHLCVSDPNLSYNVIFRTARINGNQLDFDPVFNSGVRLAYYFFVEYQPLPNFNMGNNKLIVNLNNMYNNQGHVMTYLGSYQPPITDADGDGIPDDQDDYPNDPLRAFDNYYPAAGFGSLAFEDLWPGKGDYDFNDLVVDYRFHTVTNAQNKVVDIRATFASKASGAALENGFGFGLPGASANLSSNPANITVTGSKINHNYIVLNANGHESGQSKPVVIVHDNIFNLLPQPGIGLGVNTQEWAPFVAFDTTVIRIVPSSADFGLADFNLGSWNPFLIVNKERGHEVHLPNYPATDLVDPAWFGMWEDDSDPWTGRTYKTLNNLPWAIDIPSEFAWPLEKVDITQAYHKFGAWAESGGQLFPDWYRSTQGYRNEALLYEVP
jgi:LruC domain-containing protein